MPHMLSRSDKIRHITNGELAGCFPESYAFQRDRRDHYATGRWGEALVYQYLLRRYPEWDVQWLNEKTETKASYDVQLTRGGGGGGKVGATGGGKGGGKRGGKGGGGRGSQRATIFVEVKTTRYPENNVFELSLSEWEFMDSPGIHYHVYRVYSAMDDARARIAVITDPLTMLREQELRLCLAI